MEVGGAGMLGQAGAGAEGGNGLAGDGRSCQERLILAETEEQQHQRGGQHQPHEQEKRRRGARSGGEGRVRVAICADAGADFFFLRGSAHGTFLAMPRLPAAPAGASPEEDERALPCNPGIKART